MSVEAELQKQIDVLTRRGAILVEALACYANRRLWKGAGPNLDRFSVTREDSIPANGWEPAEAALHRIIVEHEQQKSDPPPISMAMSEECWAVVDHAGNLMPWTTRRSQDSAMRAGAMVHPYLKRWSDIEAAGWRIVPVKVALR